MTEPEIRKHAALSEGQEAALQEVMATFAPDTVLCVDTMANFDASNDEDLPSGMVLTVSPDAIADVACLPDTLFTYRVVHKIKDGALSEHDVRNNNEIQTRIDENLKQYSSRPPALKLRSPTTGKDMDEWDPELGGRNARVTICKALRENMRDEDYYLMAQGTAPVAVKELKQEIAKRKPTFGQLINDENWSRKISYVRSLAQRNVKRNLSLAAQAIGIKIRDVEDVSAYASPGNAKPMRADPHWMQNTSNILPAVYQNQMAVAIYNGVVNKMACYKSKDNKFFVTSGPYNAMVAFAIPEKIDAIGLPADTGRCVASDTPSGDTTLLAKRADMGFMWDAKQEHPHHDDLADGAFNPVGGAFKASMKRAGWDAEIPPQAMVPILTKMCNPELARRNA